MSTERPGRGDAGSRLVRRGPALAALLLAGLGGLVATAQPWWRAVGDGVAARFTGTATTAGLTQALPVVLLAGALLLLVLRARGRQVLGGLLAVAAAGMVVAGALRVRPSDEAVRSGVREVSLADQFALVATSWPVVYAVAGALGVLGGMLIAVFAPRWSSGGRRFERPDLAVTTASSDPADVWRAFDAGLDPTRTTAPDPDVRETGSQATIEQRMDEDR